ncbi:MULTISPECIES: phosphotransferase [Streptomyces]|uniref:maltokinase N-terminal cap-like domain-containing protein n=1 Tax=Streptomyces TaxID=1883 RepID=UPI00140DF584|nr:MULTISPECIES: phosphotransferase [Streptomyces]MDH6228617.1 maltokinase [Streptomyces sp. MJP52]
MTKTAPLRTARPVAAEPMASLKGLLLEWLPQQRWFAGKDRPVTDLKLLSMTELHPGCLHLLVHAEHTGPPTPGGSRPGDCYQLLLGARRELPPRLAEAFIGRANAGPLAGLAVYDALREPRSAALLLDRLRHPGTTGPLSFERDTSVSLPAGLAPRLLAAEQSNTSLVYGDQYILKVFRRIQPGINPDWEVPWALARTGCTRVPAPTAWFRTSQPFEATLGVLQPFLPSATDGWTLGLNALAAENDFTREAHALGRATAEVHQALAAAFPRGPLGPEAAPQKGRLAQEMTERLHATARAVPDLRPYVPGLSAAFASLEADRPAQRIHGDLHLGQALRAGSEWFVIDFEGEPSRPLAERRSAQSPVRDVAGMLRSFDYAARTRRPWHPEWARHCRDAYCAGYALGSGWDPRDEPGVLRAYETDRAVYEVLYEARHRPDWLPVPMAAIRRLAVLGG